MTPLRLSALLLSAALPVAAQAADAPLHNYRCNTHTHTNAANGLDVNATPAEVAAWYKGHGYQCLVITDHEHMTDVAPLNATSGADRTFLVLSGQEVTQMVSDPSLPGGIRHAHVNGIGTKTAIMPVGYPEKPAGIALSETYRRNLAAIRADGGLPQINHPNFYWSVSEADLAPIDGPFLMEVANSHPAVNNQGGSDGAGHVALSTEALWDALLSKGKIVWGTATDDSHEYFRFDNRDLTTPGKGWIVIQAPELTREAIMDALRTGHFYASNGVWLRSAETDAKGVALTLASAPEGNPRAATPTRYTTRFIGKNGRLLAEVAGDAPRYVFKGNEGYVRASITDSNGKRAWTQPVFLDARK